MLQTEPLPPRRGAAVPRRNEPCTVCSDKNADIVACVHIDGLGAVRLWDIDTTYSVCGPGKHPETLNDPGCDAMFYDDLPAAEAEFRRREAALLGRTE